MIELTGLSYCVSVGLAQPSYSMAMDDPVSSKDTYSRELL